MNQHLSINKIFIGFFIFFFMSPINAFAQSLNSHLFRFSDTLETFQIEDALGPDSEMAKHRVLLRASYDYVNEPLVRLDDDRNSLSGIVVNDIHSLVFGGSILLTDRILLGVSVPFHFSSVNDTEVVAPDPDSWLLGDIAWKVKFRLTHDQSKVNFAVMPWGFFPTGRNSQTNNYLISDDSYGFGGMLMADTTFKFVKIYANAGVSGANNAEFATVDRRFRADTGLGAFVRVTDWIGLNAELLNSWTMSSFKKDQNPVQFILGLRGSFGPVRAFAGTGIESLRSNRSNEGSFQGGFKLALGNRTHQESKEVEPEKMQPSPEKVEEVVEPDPLPVVEPTNNITRENLHIRREIYFQTQSNVIESQFNEELNSAIEIILDHIDDIPMILIEGHTDSTGAAAYNLDLSQGRAQASKDYMVSKGIPAEKIEAIGYGETRMKVKEVDDQTRRINRRVEFFVDETTPKAN